MRSLTQLVTRRQSHEAALSRRRFSCGVVYASLMGTYTTNAQALRLLDYRSLTRRAAAALSACFDWHNQNAGHTRARRISVRVVPVPLPHPASIPITAGSRDRM
ncbi:hypothetical protein PENSPDRAFT_476472 [Peniophora sp. CONT]|nr:hypothetical protein PENSPDRAFT_476472 [Peniophora sp. CONT]